MSLPRLLYLGLAFPPGCADVFPEAQPAGHLIETALIDSIRDWFEIRSVGISWLRLDDAPRRGTAPGLPHEINLLECKPELLRQLASLARLKRAWKNWPYSGWKPDLVMVCNFSPVYNAFVRWLSRQPGRPTLVLYLADSMDLQREVSFSRRLRYALKPLRHLDADMARFYDACVAVSKSTRHVFSSRQAPWLWLPNGCDRNRALVDGGSPPSGKVRFGYFGTLAPHAGVFQLMAVLKRLSLDAELHLCGWGKGKEHVQRECASEPRFRFLGVKSPDECVRFVRDCDVMVNPRPIMAGNENNFSSKVFEYALGGRAILTSRLSGVEDVLGPDAFYFDANDFDSSLARSLAEICSTPKGELHQRGAAVQHRLLTEYGWVRQGARLRDFLLSVRRPEAAAASAAPR
jgi:glycosyltransferase involved in cell wall biosynthesis